MLIPVVPPPRRRPLRSAVFLGTLLGLSTGVLSALWAASLPRSELPAPLARILPEGHPPAQAAPTDSQRTPGSLTLLVMGTDRTATGNALRGNTDTLLLVHLNPDQQKVKVLSIPRDTRVDIPGHRTFKVNAANPWGGPQLAVTTVQNFLKVPIDRYLLLDLSAVSDVVDALGGLEVEIPKRMAYVDHAGGLRIDLHEGRQRLNGEQVEAFLRFRHDGQGDIGRVGRQQALLREAMPQVLHPLNWMKYPKLWAIVKAHCETDLTSQDVLAAARWLGNLDPVTDVEVDTLPGHAEMIDGLSYWIADRREARQIARRMIAPPQFSSAQPRS